MTTYTVTLFNDDTSESETYNIEAEDEANAIESAREEAVRDMQSTDSDDWRCVEIKAASAPDTREISDSEALARIQQILSGVSWDPDHIEAVADVVEKTGRSILPPE